GVGALDLVEHRLRLAHEESQLSGRNGQDVGVGQNDGADIALVGERDQPRDDLRRGADLNRDRNGGNA
ncbi:hypothetical protein ASG54_05620, partial [Aureimonas sp. Leaf460]